MMVPLETKSGGMSAGRYSVSVPAVILIEKWELLMGLCFGFFCWFLHCRASRPWHTQMPADGCHFAEGRVGGKTKLCPDVVQICPVFVLYVSKSGQILSRCGQIGVGTLRTGSNCSGETLVKIDGNSGGSESVVRCAPVHYPLPRARATIGVRYDSGGADQGQFIQPGLCFIQ